jgi:hypothetical protein
LKQASTGLRWSSREEQKLKAKPRFLGSHITQ